MQNGGSIFDFLRWVKGDPHLRDLPFVCFSMEPAEVPKYLSDGVRTAARSLGAARYITMEIFNRGAFLKEIELLLPPDEFGKDDGGSKAKLLDGETRTLPETTDKLPKPEHSVKTGSNRRYDAKL